MTTATENQRRPVERTLAPGVPAHNHLTRDIKQMGGICPACDWIKRRFDQHWYFTESA